MFKTSKVSQPSVANATCPLHPAKLLAASLIVLATCTTGCTMISNAQKALVYNDSWSEGVTMLRNRNWSAKAWHKRKHHFCNERYINDFAAGFRQGYEDVANGSDGCTPATPPRQYWSWEFQSGEGQSRMGAWFAGYPQGARAAEEEGVGSWTQMQMSSGMQNQLKQCGMMPSGPIVGSSTVQPEHQPINMQPVPMSIGEPTRVPAPAGNR